MAAGEERVALLAAASKLTRSFRLSTNGGASREAVPSPTFPGMFPTGWSFDRGTRRGSAPMRAGSVPQIVAPAFRAYASSACAVFACAIFACAFSACATDPAPGSSVLPAAVAWDTREKIGGVSLSAPRGEIPADALDPIVELGAGWIAVIPYAFVDPDDPVVHFDGEGQFWGERPAGVAATIVAAHERGLRVLVKPHLWVRGQGWPGEFAPDTDAGWGAFLASYHDYIARFAAVADSVGADMFSVGTEVDVVAAERPEFWRSLIADTRVVYDGPLTYAANWDAYGDIPFWDALDLMGIDAYFPLAGDPTPTAERLVAAWEPWAREIEADSRRLGRPILFTEFGYRSVDGTAGEHWELPSGREARGMPINEGAQAAAYEALFRVWWDRPDFAGGFLWKWYAGTPRADRVATDFTPQGKAAEAVVARWYGR